MGRRQLHIHRCITSLELAEKLDTATQFIVGDQEG